MAKGNKNSRRKRRNKVRLEKVHAHFLPRYEQAVQLALREKFAEAERVFMQLAEEKAASSKLKALAQNDLAALRAIKGDIPCALQQLEKALAIDRDCQAAQINMALLKDLGPSHDKGRPTLSATADFVIAQPARGSQLGEEARVLHDNAADSSQAGATSPIKVAIISFLFNWPSTGGGIIHTVELARFLEKAGYVVKHFYARYPAWGVGVVTAPLPFAGEALEFDEPAWNVAAIQTRFRQAVDRFDPDQVIITDSWNMKPLLAEAVEDYPFLLRFQAMECLCPLNNVRLLLEPNGVFRQCPRHQLATPDECMSCLQRHGHMSGSLHQRERALSGVGSVAYHARLLRVLRRAQAVLVVNPLTETMVSPYASKVCVVTAGMDPVRFQGPTLNALPSKAIKTIFFAGLLDEWMKGYSVLREACIRLWERRKDFELVVTGEMDGPKEDFLRCIGWLSQDELAKQLQLADMIVVPTIAQEALGRTAVEGMAAGRPVIASRIGGLPTTVQEGVTGLLFEPGNAADLARQIETLLDNGALRAEMGTAGRRRFEEHYSWDVIIARHYQPLLRKRSRQPDSAKGYFPVFVDCVDQARLVDDASRFFRLRHDTVQAMFEAYRALHLARGYARTQGEHKTLCLEEAFLIYVLVASRRPPTIVAIGTEIGKSVRRLLDIKNTLGLDGRFLAYSPEHCKRDFLPSEVEIKTVKLNGRIAQDVLRNSPPGLIFNDAHDVQLLRELVQGTLGLDKWMIALHDCGRGLCNSCMDLSEDGQVTSSTGVWERYVLAEAFGVNDPLSGDLDEQEISGHRLHIFDTRHGLGVILPAETTIDGSSSRLAKSRSSG